MPAFTKGKWVDCGDYTVGVEDNDGTIKCYICECESVDFHITDEEVRANARLIAAAPDMYNFVRCLYEMSKTLDEEDDDYFIHEVAKEILDRIHGKEDHGHDTDA